MNIFFITNYYITVTFDNRRNNYSSTIHNRIIAERRGRTKTDKERISGHISGGCARHSITYHKNIDNFTNKNNNDDLVINNLKRGSCSRENNNRCRNEFLF